MRLSAVAHLGSRAFWQSRRSAGALSPLRRQLPEHPLDPPPQRRERELLSRDPLCLFVGKLALAFAKERRTDPWTRARIAPPIFVVPLDERFANERLELPCTEIARRVVARIDVDEGVGAIIAERRRATQRLDVQVGKRV